MSPGLVLFVVIALFLAVFGETRIAAAVLLVVLVLYMIGALR